MYSSRVCDCGPVSPCRSLCEAVRDGCVPVMSAFGFPWPEMFNCTRFPRATELCIPATGEHEGRTAEEIKHEEALKGQKFIYFFFNFTSYTF